MLRIVERLFGNGVLVAADGKRTPAGYQLALYREWTPQGTELIAGGFVVDGLVMAPPDHLSGLLFTPAPLTLELEDGRRVAVFVVSEEGAVSGADDRGIEEARA
jgi:hypothetical protein